MVVSLPVDGVWKALYFVLAASTFWIAGAVSYMVLSPAIPNWTAGNVAAKAVMSLVTIVGTALLLAVVTAILARIRQDDEDNDAITIPHVEQIDSGVYVALGDSYSAGEGLAPFRKGTEASDPDGPPACHRSDKAYPMLLEFVNDVEREFVACSGAITADLDLPPEKRDHPPQLDAEPRKDVTLVTVTIGGNDATFARVVQACFFFEDCIDADFEPPAQDDGHRRVIFPAREPLEAWAKDALTLLERNVERVYPSIAKTYPNARRVVIGYPYLFPEGSALWQNDCALVLRRVKEEERKSLRELTDRLNAMLANQASAAGLEFISPTAAWDGHEPCGNDGQYTNALKPFGSGWKPLDGGSFHPNSQGQRALARLVACYLNANPTAPTPANPPQVGTCPSGSPG